MEVKSSEACLEQIAGLRVFRIQGAGYQAYLDTSGLTKVGVIIQVTGSRSLSGNSDRSEGKTG
jgi:hypothetical protein